MRVVCGTRIKLDDVLLAVDGVSVKHRAPEVVSLSLSLSLSRALSLALSLVCVSVCLAVSVSVSVCPCVRVSVCPCLCPCLRPQASLPRRHIPPSLSRTHHPTRQPSFSAAAQAKEHAEQETSRGGGVECVRRARAGAQR
eukprot:1907577-Rhodomonas_salina.2